MESKLHLSPTWIAVVIHKVEIPGAIVSNGTSNKQSLEQYGKFPFTLICLRSWIRVSVAPAPVEFLSPPHTTEPQTTDLTADLDTSSVTSDAETPAVGLLLLNVTRRGHLISLPDSYQKDSRHEIDTASQKEGTAMLQSLESILKLPYPIQSRVLKDIFHVFDMFYIPAGHGLLFDYAVALGDAIFILDPSDKARIMSWAAQQNPPLTWNDLLHSCSSWLWRRCKQYVPPPELLYPLVSEVFQAYGPLKDAKTGLRYLTQLLGLLQKMY